MDAAGPSLGFSLLFDLREHKRNMSWKVSVPPDERESDPSSSLSYLPGIERLLERILVSERRISLFQFGELDVHVLCASFAVSYEPSTAHRASKDGRLL